MKKMFMHQVLISKIFISNKLLVELLNFLTTESLEVGAFKVSVKDKLNLSSVAYQVSAV